MNLTIIQQAVQRAFPGRKLTVRMIEEDGIKLRFSLDDIHHSQIPIGDAMLLGQGTVMMHFIGQFNALIRAAGYESHHDGNPELGQGPAVQEA